MPEENKIIENTNWNPYDLVDHKDQTTNNWSQADKKMGEKWPSDFFRSLIKLIAKLSGQPDPETWQKPREWSIKVENWANQDGKKDTAAFSATIDKAKNIAWNIMDKTKNNFESVMNSVSGVMDKIESKIEQKAWIAPKTQAPNLSQEKSELEKDIENEEKNSAN